jgi:hypothetical protein
MIIIMSRTPGLTEIYLRLEIPMLTLLTRSRYGSESPGACHRLLPPIEGQRHPCLRQRSSGLSDCICSSPTLAGLAARARALIG